MNLGRRGAAALGGVLLLGLAAVGYDLYGSGQRLPFGPERAAGRGDDARRVAFAVRRGVNLEGWLDQPQFSGLGEDRLSQLPRIRAAGFDFVRLLLNPQALLGARGDEPAATLRRVLRAARQADLKVLVSLYTENAHDKAAVLEGGQAQETYLALLERTARELSAGDARWVAFEPLAEAADCAASPSGWTRLQSRFVGAARRGFPELTLVVSGPCYADYESLTDLRPLNDSNVLYSFLYVEPLLFTQQGNPGNPDWAMFRHVPYPFTAAQLSPVLRSVLAGIPSPDRRAEVRQAFSELAQADFSRTTLQRQIARAGDWGRQNSVGVLLSAFAVRNSAPAGDRARWLGDVRQAAEAADMPWAVWSWTSPFGFEVSENGVLQPAVREALGLP